VPPSASAASMGAMDEKKAATPGAPGVGVGATAEPKKKSRRARSQYNHNARCMYHIILILFLSIAARASVSSWCNLIIINSCHPKTIKE
jgi:hypothetical protein